MYGQEKGRPLFLPFLFGRLLDINFNFIVSLLVFNIGKKALLATDCKTALNSSLKVPD
jgi:hypothetical protein